MTDTEVDTKKWKKDGGETSGNYSESDTNPNPKPKYGKQTLAINKSLLNPIVEADYIEELRGQTIISEPKSIDGQGVSVKGKLTKPVQQMAAQQQ